MFYYMQYLFNVLIKSVPLASRIMEVESLVTGRSSEVSGLLSASTLTKNFSPKIFRKD